MAWYLLVFVLSCNFRPLQPVRTHYWSYPRWWQCYTKPKGVQNWRQYTYNPAVVSPIANWSEKYWPTLQGYYGVGKYSVYWSTVYEDRNIYT